MRTLRQMLACAAVDVAVERELDNDFGRAQVANDFAKKSVAYDESDEMRIAQAMLKIRQDIWAIKNGMP